jgi:peptidoglycan/LPS O-acetylase OafA/YrhL
MRMDATQEASRAASDENGHVAVLDGWRGVSILLVLAAHLLPLGPRALQLNLSAGVVGMAIFFNLSGLLITTHLLKDDRVTAFLIKRFCRVLPLAWLYLALALTLSAAPISTWLSHFLFYANLPRQDLLPMTEHLWSLCVEIQFYVGIALLVLVLRVRGLLLLPLLGLMFTLLRAWNGALASSVSYYRIDEILSGCGLALALHGQHKLRFRKLLAAIPQLPLLVLLIAASMPQGGWLNYLRPYVAALLIGATIVHPETSLVRWLGGRFLLFCAGISFALYVFHPMLRFTWLGSGGVELKYAKRPLFLIVLFVLAYASTRYYESWFIARGRRWIQRRRSAPAKATEALQPTLLNNEQATPNENNLPHQPIS